GVFWRRNVEPLAEHFRVITMDLRGHGDSEKPASGYRIARLARDMKDVIEALELEDLAVAGWSMGSSIIWSYLELFGSEHLSKAVFVVQSPRQYYTNDWKWGQTSCYDAEALAFLTARLECDPRGMAKALLDGCLAEPVAEPEESELIDEIMKSPGWVRAEIMSDHTNLDWRSFLPFISIPSLVIVGRKDKIFPWQGCAYVGDRIPGARTVFFEESSHMPFYEEADKFNTVVRNFVDG
ncbi:MAG: alpha/beta hydrolase, partial [Rhodospirillales bacterium]|nr:alpha/beta hydrolase [Rhodospirillales bacterium]